MLWKRSAYCFWAAMVERRSGSPARRASIAAVSSRWKRTACARGFGWNWYIRVQPAAVSYRQPKLGCTQTRPADMGRCSGTPARPPASAPRAARRWGRCRGRSPSGGPAARRRGVRTARPRSPSRRASSRSRRAARRRRAPRRSGRTPAGAGAAPGAGWRCRRGARGGRRGSARTCPPPFVCAQISVRPSCGHTRYSAPPATLVTTSVPSSHQTGPSENGMPFGITTKRDQGTPYAPMCSRACQLLTYTRRA